MKILLVSNMYPDEKNPQFGVFVKNSEDVLIDNKFVIDKVICTKKKSKSLKIVQYIYFYIKTLFKILVNDYNYIYVHYLSHSALPIIIAKKIRKKINIIGNVHGSDLIPQNNKHKLLNRLGKKCAEISNILIVPSNYFKKEIITRWNINEEKVYIYPSGGVNNKVFNPRSDSNKCKEKIGLKKSYKYIGFVSRLESEKGWDILLDAINELKDNKIINNYRFIFVGNGKELEDFKNKVKYLNLDELIIHIDFLNQLQLADLYNCLELFCFPTEANESLGLVGIEALACGVPVVASNFAALREYVINGHNGYLFEKGNFNDLSNKIEQYIVLSEKEKIIMKNYAYESSKKYWTKNIEKNFIDIFDSIKNRINKSV